MKLQLNKYLDKTIQLKYRSGQYSLFDLKHQWQIQKWMRILFPTATVQDHLDFRDTALQAVEELEEEWDKLLKDQFEKTFGRKKKDDEHYYAGIGYNEFPTEVKAVLQTLHNVAQSFNRIALMHDLMLPMKERNSRRFFINRLPEGIRSVILNWQIERLRKKSQAETATGKVEETNNN